MSASNPSEDLEIDLSNYRFVQLDVFTREPFAGNPLAVFPQAEGLTDEQMMKIAREMNLSETVFVLKGNSNQQSAISKQPAESESPAESTAPMVLRRLRMKSAARQPSTKQRISACTMWGLKSKGVGSVSCLYISLPF